MKPNSLLLICFLNLAFPAFAQSGTQSATQSAPDISGIWWLRFDSTNIPDAKLVPSITSAVIARHNAADADTVRWCRREGMPAMMAGPGTIDIIQSEPMIAIRAEKPSASRQI